MESPWKILWLSISVSLYFSLFGLPFTLGLAGAYALVRRVEGSAWLIPPTSEMPSKKVHYMWIAVLGGIGGDFAAVNSVFIGEWWICRTQHQLCYDGQGAIILVITVPLLALVGALIAWGWTWLTLRMPPHQLWASIFRYRGSLRWLNWLLSVVIPIGFWALVTVGLIRATL